MTNCDAGTGRCRRTLEYLQNRSTMVDVRSCTGSPEWRFTPAHAAGRGLAWFAAASEPISELGATAFCGRCWAGWVCCLATLGHGASQAWRSGAISSADTGRVLIPADPRPNDGMGDACRFDHPDGPDSGFVGYLQPGFRRETWTAKNMAHPLSKVRGARMPRKARSLLAPASDGACQRAGC